MQAKKINLKLLILFYIVLSVPGHTQISIKHFPIWSETRKKLTVAYQKQHYGRNTFLLENPQMIVIHYTAINSLTATLHYFKQAYLPKARKRIAHGGKLNVGVHFVVDRDGTVYSLLPEHVAGRHVIGFNHTAFGIENVALNAKQLTGAQVRANARLVAYLVKKYPSVKYLAGHHEYTKKAYPHFRLYRELDKRYTFTRKVDPGKPFMKQLRSLLKDRYMIMLKK